jgi:hypothetical protein
MAFGLGALAKGAAKGSSKGMSHAFVGAATGIGMNFAFEKAMGSNNSEALKNGVMWYAAERMVGQGVMMIPMVAEAAEAGYSMYRDHKLYGKGELAQYYRSNFGGNYQDTQQAYTMRQRAVQAMQQSRMNARSVLGSEARTLHR